MGVHRRRPCGLGDEGAEVFDLALDRVRGGVTAVAPAATVVVEHGEMLCQLLGGRAGHRPVAELPAHNDDRRTIAQPVEGDGGAVARRYRIYGALLPIVHAISVRFSRPTGAPATPAREGRPARPPAGLSAVGVVVCHDGFSFRRVAFCGRYNVGL